MKNSHCFKVLAILLAMAITPSTSFALDVDAAEWGFDGRILTSEFNLLSVQVSNPTDTDFDGQLVLSRTSFGGSTVGARIVADVYLSAHSTRWVQFYPYCDGNSTWVIRWNRNDRFSVPSPRTGDEKPILLQKRDELSFSGRGIQRFSEELFPPSVSATKTLKVIVIGHVPRWEAPRRRAFIDWLHLGGVVHLVKNDDGQYPKFTEELAQLNSPLSIQRLGAGVVFRHELGVDDIDKDSLATIESTRKRFFESLSGRDEEPVTSKSTQQVLDDTWNDINSLWDSQDRMFTTVKEMTKPEHNWALICLLSFVYIGLIFPGCFLLGRDKRTHYLLTYGAIVAAVVLFSVIFLAVGRRGYGEESAIHSVAIAQQIQKDDWDVIQFSNAFATNGETYEIKHTGRGRLYSTCSTSEAVNGDIRNGTKGGFTVDIPPFSNRSFATRMKVRMPELSVTKQSFRGFDRLTGLDIKVGETFPKAPIAIFVQYRDRFYKVNFENDLISIKTNALELKTFLNLNDYDSFSTRNIGYDRMSAKKDEEQQFKGLWQSLTARFLGVVHDRKRNSYSLPNDRARLFVFAEAPDQLNAAGDKFSKQVGLVLYAVDILRNDTNGK